MNSVISFPERNNQWGRSSYRGNCSGYVQKSLFEQFHSKEVTDPMAGSYTTRDVALEMGIISHCYDLSTGFNALLDEVPEEACGSDTWFFHPPYGAEIHIPYAGYQWSDEEFIKKYGYDPKPYDLGQMPWEEFINALNYCVMKFYASMETGARMCILMGDVRRNEKYYSMIRDICMPGTLESIICKIQNNAQSFSKTYSNNNFIAISHEYIMVFKKTGPYILDYVLPRIQKLDIRDSKCATWRDVVRAALVKLGGTATLEAIYAEIEGHEKAKDHEFWKEKIRQTLQNYKMFKPVVRGTWKMVA